VLRETLRHTYYFSRPAEQRSVLNNSSFKCLFKHNALRAPRTHARLFPISTPCSTMFTTRPALFAGDLVLMIENLLKDARRPKHALTTFNGWLSKAKSCTSRRHAIVIYCSRGLWLVDGNHAAVITKWRVSASHATVKCAVLAFVRSTGLRRQTVASNQQKVIVSQKLLLAGELKEW